MIISLRVVLLLALSVLMTGCGQLLEDAIQPDPPDGQISSQGPYQVVAKENKNGQIELSQLVNAYTKNYFSLVIQKNQNQIPDDLKSQCDQNIKDNLYDSFSAFTACFSALDRYCTTPSGTTTYICPPQAAVTPQITMTDLTDQSNSQPANKPKLPSGDTSLPSKVARSAIQEQIIMAADRRCEVFKIALTKTEASAQFFTSAFSAILGTAGAFTPASTSQILAGAAGATSGVGAAFNAAYFKNQTTRLLIYGINQSRLDVRNQINENRDSTLAQYPLAQAVSDAMRYNGACSVNTALDKVNSDLNARSTPDPLAVAKETVRQTWQMCIARAPVDTKGDNAKLKVALTACEDTAKAMATAAGFDFAELKPAPKKTDPPPKNG